MKKIFWVLIGIIFFAFGLNSPVGAIWPPETSMDKPVNTIGEQRPLSPGMKTLIERLENDERELMLVVEQLKRDEKKISELTDLLMKKELAAPAVKEKK